MEGRDAVRLKWSNPTTGAWTSDGGEAPSAEGRKGEVVEAVVVRKDRRFALEVLA